MRKRARKRVWAEERWGPRPLFFPHPALFFLLSLSGQIFLGKILAQEPDRAGICSPAKRVEKNLCNPIKFQIRLKVHLAWKNRAIPAAKDCIIPTIVIKKEK